MYKLYNNNTLYLFVLFVLYLFVTYDCLVFLKRRVENTKNVELYHWFVGNVGYFNSLSTVELGFFLILLIANATDA